jgi:hypothetical protein
MPIITFVNLGFFWFLRKKGFKNPTHTLFARLNESLFLFSCAFGDCHAPAVKFIVAFNCNNQA